MSPLLYKRLSDESLGRRLASGEAAAFDELYRRYVHRLAAYGSHLLGDPAAGDDVAQSTLLKAYGALRDGRVPDKMRPWLLRIAHNAAIDVVARRRELPSEQLPEISSREPEPMAGALVTALAALPERQRRVYVLRELHGMRIAETAAELGLGTAQVEQALFAARNRLAELLVFGDRLDCATVQRLAAGPLDGDERRALKTHLRSCPGCRTAVGLHARGLGWLPVPSLEWLRGLLVGGAAPAAAKVGAVVATATVAAGVPVALHADEHHRVHPPRAPARAAARAPLAAPHPFVIRSALAQPVVAIPVSSASSEGDRNQPSQAEHTVAETRDGGGGGEDHRVGTHPTVTTADGVEPSATGESGQGGGDRPASTASGPPTTTTETERTSSSSDGGGDNMPTTTTDVALPTSPPPTTTVPTTTTQPAATEGPDGSTTSDGGS